MCPRSTIAPSNVGARDANMHTTTTANIGLYERGMNVLTVGDGDFSFSLALAHLAIGDTQNDNDNANDNESSSGMIVATSYEDAPTLRNVYPDFDTTLESLTSYNNGNNNRNCNDMIIGYNVDATRLNDTLPQETKTTKFHRICWNFPCTAIHSGQDGQNDAMDANKELVRKFVANALPYLTDDGEIHMCHKTKPPYNQWGLEQVALEGIANNNSSSDDEFEYKGRIVLDKCTLPPYTPRKALDRKSFPCHDACFFVFGWKRRRRRRRHVKASSQYFASSIPEENHSDSLVDNQPIMPVTKEVLDRIRSIHLMNSKQFGSNKRNGKRKNKRRKKN